MIISVFAGLCQHSGCAVRSDLCDECSRRPGGCSKNLPNSGVTLQIDSTEEMREEHRDDLLKVCSNVSRISQGIFLTCQIKMYSFIVFYYCICLWQYEVLMCLRVGKKQGNKSESLGLDTCHQMVVIFPFERMLK